MAEHNDKGNEGEEIAATYLAKNGYQVLERNWRFLKFEIDIVARKEDQLIVAEVKRRLSNTFGEPEVFVNLAKQRRLIRAAHYYVTTKDLDVDVRFDIISITGEGESLKIRHLEGAFFPMASRF